MTCGSALFAQLANDSPRDAACSELFGRKVAAPDEYNRSREISGLTFDPQVSSDGNDASDARLGLLLMPPRHGVPWSMHDSHWRPKMQLVNEQVKCRSKHAADNNAIILKQASMPTSTQTIATS